MRFKSGRAITIFIIINLFLLVLFFRSLNQKPPPISFKDHPYQEKDYILKPIRNKFETDIKIEYPTVQTAPTALQYPLVLLKEKFYLNDDHYDHIFFANKRIAELDKWGNEMPAKGKNFSSWQASLNRYHDTIKKHLQKKFSSPLNDAATIESLFNLKILLSVHHNKLDSLIYKLPRSKAEKLYLKLIIDRTFESLNQKLNAYLPISQPNQLTYSLFEILRDKEYGVYNIYVNSDRVNPTIYPSLLINNIAYNRLSFAPNESNTGSFYLGAIPSFQDIKIDKDSNLLILEFPKRDMEIAHRAYVWPEVVLYKKSSLTSVTPSSTTHKLNNGRYLITNTKTTASQDAYTFNSLGPGWKVIQRVDNDYVSKFMIIFWPTRVIFLFWLASLVLVFLSLTNKFYARGADLVRRRSFNLVFETLIMPIKFHWRLLKRFCAKLKLILFLVAFISTIYYIFLYKSFADFIIVSLIVLWIIVLIGYRAQSRISFIITFAFLSATPFILAVNNYFIAEKIMTWSYIFLIMGALHSFIEKSYH